MIERPWRSEDAFTACSQAACEWQTEITEN